MDKKTAWATLVNPQARIYKSKRLVTEALKISLERKTNGIPLPSLDFPVTLLLVGIYTTLPPKVDRISLNSNVYRNGVFADEYLCFFSLNERKRERITVDSRMQFAPLYLPSSGSNSDSA